MRRDQLEHAIRTACQIIDRPEVIVAGSQAILGNCALRESYCPRQPPVIPGWLSGQGQVQAGGGTAAGAGAGLDEVAEVVDDP
jgi:hypothetical protein